MKTLKKIPKMLHWGVPRRFEGKSVYAVLSVSIAASVILCLASALLLDMGVSPLVAMALGQVLVIALATVESARLEKAGTIRAEQMSSPTHRFYAPRIKFSGAVIGSSAAAIAASATSLLSSGEDYPPQIFAITSLFMLSILVVQSLEMVRSFGHLTDDDGRDLADILESASLSGSDSNDR